MTVILVVVAGVAVVLLTSILKNTDWSPRYKNLLATVLSVIAAVLLFVGGIDLGTVTTIDVLGLITSVYGTSQLVYNFILTGTGLEHSLAEKKVL